MKIVVDIDDTILETSKDIVYRLESHFGIKFDWNSITEYDLERIFCLDHDIVRKFIDESLEGSTSKPFYDCVATLNFIGESHSPIFIVSHRQAYLYDHTKKRLDDLGIKQYALILSYSTNSQGTPDKSRIINDLQADVAIDDRPDIIMDIYNNTSVHIIIMDRPWNRSIRDNDRLIRVFNWNMIKDVIGVINETKRL